MGIHSPNVKFVSNGKTYECLLCYTSFDALDENTPDAVVAHAADEHKATEIELIERWEG